MLNANFAYTGGQTQYNALRKSIAQNTSIAAGLDGNLKEQACIVASVMQGQRRATDWCFMETVKSLRFQDLAITYEVQPSIARLFHANSASISLTGSNIYLWTNFKGRDPGYNTTPVSGNAVVAGPAFAAPREWGLRVRLGF
jgi:hypothetical protein